MPDPPPPYNPLDRVELGRAVERRLLEQRLDALPPPVAFGGAGLYAVYYVGDFRPYERLVPPYAEPGEMPIYVGRAIPRGARAGGRGLEATTTEPVLYQRLRDHARSIEQVELWAALHDTPNVRLRDFRCRHLVVDDIWVPLGEALLIGHYRPLWNQTVQGFGNHDPGAGRRRGARSDWDELHPGRSWAVEQERDGRCVEVSIVMITEHLARVVKPDLNATPRLDEQVQQDFLDEPGS